MGGGSAVTPDTAVTLSISKLAALLGVKPTLLKDILGTTEVELRDQPKIIAGGIDTERDMGFWTFFNNMGSIPTLNVPRELALPDIKRNCLNGGVNAGTQSILIKPAAHSIVIIHFASLVNLDTVDRAAGFYLQTAGAALVSILNVDATLGASTNLVYPPRTVGGNDIHMKPPLFLTDAFQFLSQVAAVAVNQDSSYFLLYTYVGDAPTITETSPAGAVWSDVT